MAFTTSFKGEPLVGKSNFIKWHINARLYWEINRFMLYINSIDLKPRKDLYYNGNMPKSNEFAIKFYEKELEYNKNNNKALGAIKSIISLKTSKRFKDKTTAFKLYKAIVDSFGESSLELIGRYFDKLIDSNYNSFKSIDKYISNIQLASIYLFKLKHKLPKLYII